MCAQKGSQGEKRDQDHQVARKQAAAGASAGAQTRGTATSGKSEIESSERRCSENEVSDRESDEKPKGKWTDMLINNAAAQHRESKGLISQQADW